MATYYSGWKGYTGSIYLRMKIVTSYTQNTSANTSTVTIKQYIEAKDYSMYGAVSDNHKLVHTGTTYTNSNYEYYDSNGSKLIQTRTKTITHNSSGKASFSFSGSASCNISDDSGVGHSTTLSIGTKTISLPTINRTSSISSSATSSTEFGDTINFTITRHDSSFTHDITYKMGSQTGTIASDVATSTSWEIPTSLIQYVTDSDKSNISITCVTKSGSTTIGSQTITITAKVPDSYVPTCSLALSVVNDVNWNIYLRNFSKVHGVITASGDTGSTIKSYKTIGNNETLTTQEFTTGLLQQNDSETFVTTVTDSRGRTATDSKKISIVNYELPTITSIRIDRCLQDGTLNDEGTYGKTTVEYSINPVEYYEEDANGLLVVESGAEEGEINLEDVTPTLTSYTPAVNDKVSLQTLNTKSISVSVSGNTITETPSNYSGTHTFTTLISGLATNSSYEATINLIDSITTTTQTFVINPSYITISLLAGGKGVTLGRDAIREGFDVYVNTYFNNKNNYFKRQSVDGTVTEKSNNVYIRYIE